MYLINLIKKEKKQHTVKMLCNLYQVPKSSFYERINRKESKRAKENKMLKDKINQIYKDSKKRYGAPKITKQMKRKGYKISLKRTQRLMRKLDIRSITYRKFKYYSGKSNSNFKGRNLLKQNFNTEKINEKWVTDITYVHTVNDGWCYLASVMDLHTKKIVGHAFDKHMKKELVIRALRNACKSQKIKKNNQIILHSDRGVQYTSKAYTRIAERKGFRLSYSDKGNPYDNACIESFHSILKKEETKHNTYKNYKEAKLKIFKFIESWYNRKRIHSSIDYMTPVEFERKCVA